MARPSFKIIKDGVFDTLSATSASIGDLTVNNLTITGKVVCSNSTCGTCASCSSNPLLTKYVKGGSCSAGDGSKTSPYATLADADADTTWTTLIVLASPVALVGGLNMRAGTCLLGEKNPNACSGVAQCILSNPTNIINDGNVVTVLSGNVCIKNIYFRDIWASAIRYDNATDLSVENCLIEGYNKGLLVEEMKGPTDDPQFVYHAVAGINAQNANPGTTTLCRVVAGKNYAGNGSYEEVYGGASRKYVATSCLFYNMVNGIDSDSFPDPIEQNNFMGGIWVNAFGGSIIDVQIKNCTCENFNQDSPYPGSSYPFMCSPTNSTFTFLVDGCRVYNCPALLPGQQHVAVYLFANWRYKMPTAGPQSGGTALIQNSSFEILEETINPDVGGNYCFNPHTGSTIVTATFTDNLLINYKSAVLNLSMGQDNDLTVNVFNNVSKTVNGSGVGLDIYPFVIATTATEDAGYYEHGNQNGVLNVSNNVSTGGDFGILVIPNACFLGMIIHPCGYPSTWTSLTINANDNCFDGKGFGTSALAGFNIQPPPTAIGEISGTTMTLSLVPFGVFFAPEIIQGVGVTPGTTIVNQLTGTPGGAGTYTVSISQTVPPGTQITVDFDTGILTVQGSNNNLVGYAFNVLNLGQAPATSAPNINYLAPQNYWAGNTTVLNLGSGVVDISNPLANAVECSPQYCLE